MSARIRDAGWPPGLAATACVGEYQIPQRAPVEFAIRGEDAACQSAAITCARPGVPGCDHGTGGLVGVDDRYAEFREALR